jgi:TrfA protein
MADKEKTFSPLAATVAAELADFAPAQPIAKTPGERVREMAERVAQQDEAAKLYQLALWPENRRAMPTSLVRSALFAAIHGKDATYIDGVEIASINDLSIKYTGQRLTQVHADVWEGVMHLARGAQEAQKVSFRAKAFLRLIGRHTGKSQREELKSLFRQLTATCVEVHDTKNNRHFFGSLLPQGADKDENDDTLYVVEINRHLARLFDRGFSTVDWEQRKRLRAKPLSLWLQHHFAAFDKPISVAELHRLSGSTSKTLFHFRANLKAALTELKAVGVLADWYLDDSDAVHVARPGKELPAPFRKPQEPPATASAVQGDLALPGAPAVSQAARSQFDKRYPTLDVAQCLADWHAWLMKSGRSAEKPDAAFLGFAKTWSADRK